MSALMLHQPQQAQQTTVAPPTAVQLDPFLQSMALTAHQTIKHADEDDATPIAAESKEDADAGMEDAEQSEPAAAASAAAVSASAAPRDGSFLQSHIAGYQRRIEDMLAYLQEFRFGRGPSAATAPIAALGRGAAELRAEVRSLESEWSTWLLLAELRHSDEAARDAPVPPSVPERHSQVLVAQRLVRAPGHPLGRVLRILNWLEELQVLVLRIESTGEVSWRRSLRALQTSKVGDPQRDWIDPDVELRLRKAGALPAGQRLLDQQDTEEEQRLLEYVWSLLRAGRLPEAIKLCRTYQQHWRAASLQGGELLHDDGVRGPDGSVYRVGNPRRQLWRHTCRKLAQASGVSAVESSIYGLLGGDLPSALSYSGQHKYDDALYCYLKLMVDDEVDAFIRAEGKTGTEDESVPPAERAHMVQRTLAAVLQALESPLNTLVTPAVHAQATHNPYVRLQKWLMLGEHEQAEAEMVDTIRKHYRPMQQSQQQQGQSGAAVLPSSEGQAVNHTYLLFAFHLYLYLHPRAPHGEPLNAAGEFLCRAYLSYLESQTSQHALVPAYAQYLSAPARVSYYVRFLQRIPSLEARQALLAAFAEYCPDERLEVTRNLVQNILGDETDGTTRTAATTTQQGRLQLVGGAGTLETGGFPSGSGGAGLAIDSSGVSNLLAGAGGVTPQELEKITSIDCFDVSGAHVDLRVVQEALVQVTQLYRSFVSKDKHAAAKRFTEHLQAKRWDHHIFAIIQQQHMQQNDGARQDTTRTTGIPPVFVALDREYGHWKLYIRCLNWYDAWLTHHSAEPRAPTFQPAAYTHKAQARAEYEHFKSKYAAYQTLHKAWADERDADHSPLTECVSALMELLQLEGGWLTPSAASLAPLELHTLRRQCVPRLVFMLVQVHTHSKQEERVLAVADLVAAPLHNLHACFTPDQLRALLQHFRAAYIKAQLQPNNSSSEEHQTDQESQAMRA